MKVSVVALGISNLGSLVEALRRVGASPEVIGTPREILSSPRLVLPGVGAFGEGMASILRLGLKLPLQDYAASGRPLLGICLGMQLLFDASHEYLKMILSGTGSMALMMIIPSSRVGSIPVDF